MKWGSTIGVCMCEIVCMFRWLSAGHLRYFVQFNQIKLSLQIFISNENDYIFEVFVVRSKYKYNNFLNPSLHRSTVNTSNMRHDNV